MSSKPMKLTVRKELIEDKLKPSLEILRRKLDDAIVNAFREGSTITYLVLRSIDSDGLETSFEYDQDFD